MSCLSSQISRKNIIFFVTWGASSQVLANDLFPVHYCGEKSICLFNGIIVETRTLLQFVRLSRNIFARIVLIVIKRIAQITTIWQCTYAKALCCVVTLDYRFNNILRYMPQVNNFSPSFFL